MSHDPFSLDRAGTFDMFGSGALHPGSAWASPPSVTFRLKLPMMTIPISAAGSGSRPPVSATPLRRAGLRANFYLDGDRELGATWKDRARAKCCGDPRCRRNC